MAWQDRVRNWYEGIQKEFGEGSVSGSQRAEVQLGSKIPVFLEVLERLKKEGMIVPLTKEILRLPDRAAAQGGFDTRA